MHAHVQDSNEVGTKLRLSAYRLSIAQMYKEYICHTDTTGKRNTKVVVGEWVNACVRVG